jgi:tRNA-splicing ligase RtcB
MSRHVEIATENLPIKAWVQGVPVEEAALAQLRNVARLPVVHGWVAAMPDVHWGIGATVGSVIPTRDAIIPAAVGVDIGCGMIAARTSLHARDLPDDLGAVRNALEQAIPHGRTDGGGPADRGAFRRPPTASVEAWHRLAPGYARIVARHPKLDRGRHVEQLGTLGSGNHFVELCIDEGERVWVMLHSGSRGVGNRIGMHFIELARRDMRTHLADLPDRDLAYLQDGTEHFDDYVHAVGWAQDYAATNRHLMMAQAMSALRGVRGMQPFRSEEQVVQCHHNYVARERHLGSDLWITRKGAVRAGRGELGIIPGSMGARSFIVRGRGSAESFESCSHGAGRAMSRRAAARRFTVEDHARMTEGIECRKDEGVLDETPAAYKDIDAVMAAQTDLVDVVHTLRQVVVVKG